VEKLGNHTQPGDAGDMAGGTEPQGFRPSAEKAFARLLRFVAPVAGGASALLGLTVLAGWLLRAPALTRLLPGAVVIRPNAALGFLLCGVALFLLAPASEARRPGALRIGRAGAAAAALLGALTLLEYVAQIDLGIDLLLFRQAQLASPATVAGGRMGVNAAFNFALLGSALLLLGRGRRFKPAEILAVLALTVAVMALVGHLFGEADFYALRHYTPMAVPGAIAFTALALGLMCARPAGGLMGVVASEGAGGALARRLLPWMLVTPTLVGWLRFRGEHAGYFDLEFGLAIMVVSSMALLTVVVLLTARSLTAADARRHDAERKLRRTEVLVSAVFDATPDSINVKDRSGRYALINSAGARLLGHTIAEVIGRTDAELLAPATARARDAQREAILDSGKNLVVEEQVTVDGSPRIYLATKGIYRDEHGEPAGTFAMSRDVTDVKQVDEVRRARDAAEAANQELEAFSYSVSHDLRAPLRSIDGFSQALLEDYAARLDQTGHHYLERVRANAQRMAQLIDDLLALSRVSRSDLQRAPVDLTAAARDIVAELHRAHPDRQVEVVIAEGLHTSGDGRLLGIVLQNLLGNAWKFTAKRAPARIELGRTDQNGHSAFYVRDNGAGFDMRYSDKLFGAFQRLHSPAEFEGTGIGLATVQRIVTRHGGRVWAEGEIDRGATFYFALQ
jgi:PAS domain S-box-containing protein